MNPNAIPSDAGTIVATIPPQSSSTAKSSDWVSMSDAGPVFAVIMTGTMGASGTVDAKLRQATDDAGAGAKDIATKAITQLVKASHDNVTAMIVCWPEELDINNGFTHLQLVITPGTSASLIAGSVVAPMPRYGAASVALESAVETVGYGPPQPA